MYVALPEMTPLKVLTLARCVAFSPDESDLLKVAKRLQFCKEVNSDSFFVNNFHVLLSLVMILYRMRFVLLEQTVELMTTV